MLKRCCRGVTPVFVAALIVPLVFAQPAAPPDPRSQAKELLKPYASKIYRDNKSAKEVLESLKLLEALADETHEAMWDRVRGVLTYPDQAVRLQVPKTLAAIGVGRGSDPHARAKFLASGFKAKDPELAAAYVEALMHLGPHYVKPHVPDYVEASKHDDVRVRRAATAAFISFRDLKESEGQLLAAAIAALDDDLEEKIGMSCVVRNALIYLQFRGTGAKEAAPQLIRFVNSKKGSEHLHFRALGTLAKAAPEEPLPLKAAREWLKKTESPNVLLKGMGIAAALGPHAKQALRDLIAVAKLKPFKDAQVEFQVKLSLIHPFGQMGPAATDALAALGELAASNDPTLRDAVRSATKRIVADK